MGLAAFLVLVGFALTGGVSYIYITPSLHLPFFDDGDGPKLITAGLGAAWAFWGTIQGWRLGKGVFMKLVLTLMFFLAAGLTGLISYHATVLAKQVPTPPEAIKAGFKFPEFKLKDQEGVERTPMDLRNKRAIIVFYRANYCPFCVDELDTVESVLADIQKDGGEVFAISAGTVESNRALASARGYKLRLLADPGLVLIKELKLTMSDMSDKGETVEVSRPAVLFLNSDGTVAQAHFATDYRKHLTAEELRERFKQTK